MVLWNLSSDNHAFPKQRKINDGPDQEIFDLPKVYLFFQNTGFMQCGH